MMDKNTRENERMNYTLRVEAIRDFCTEALRINENKISAQKKFVRK
jgi:ribosomal protein S18